MSSLPDLIRQSRQHLPQARSWITGSSPVMTKAAVKRLNSKEPFSVRLSGNDRGRRAVPRERRVHPGDARVVRRLCRAAGVKQIT